MALPANIQTQLNALNAAVNRLLDDRGRINAYFEDGLGASIFSLLTTQNQTIVKNALIADMMVAANEIDAVIAALNAL
jgi:hypothetical protein